MYDMKKATWGAELEVSDVDRRVQIPEHLGKWSLCETDIINRHGERRGLACDPLGLEPHWGGEVNLLPANSVHSAGERMRSLIDYLHSVPGNKPDYDTFNAAHIHVQVPGLREDVGALKRLAEFIRQHQRSIIEHSFRNYRPPAWSKSRRKVHTIPLDGKRMMPEWMLQNLRRASSVDEFFSLQYKGKDGVTNYRIFRYSFHLYNMKDMGTLEFRFFRPTLNPAEWAEMFRFVQDFMNAALNGGSTPRVDDYGCWPAERSIDLELWEAWEATRYSQDRFLAGAPRRTLREAR